MIRKPSFVLNEVCYSCGLFALHGIRGWLKMLQKIFIQFSIKAPMCLLPLMQLVPILHYNLAKKTSQAIAIMCVRSPNRQKERERASNTLS